MDYTVQHSHTNSESLLLSQPNHHSCIEPSVNSEKQSPPQSSAGINSFNPLNISMVERNFKP